MFSITLLATVTLAISAAANPVVVRDSLVSLPLVKRFNFTGTSRLLDHDQARARGLQAFGRAKAARRVGRSDDAVVSVPAVNELVNYALNVGVGSPATTYSLLLDTGSSNTWVGANKPFVRTSTSVQTNDRVAVTYGSGDFQGTEFTDTVTLGPGLTIQKQSIGVASRSEGFDGVDGIIGIGPVDLTVDTLSPDTRATIPTVTDNLFSQGVITQNLVAVSFEPTNSEEITNGEVTFGGTDSSKFTGSISFTPITSTSPASEFWGINQSITLGSTSILSNTAGIVDTGTTLVLIASDAFTRYQRATGGVQDNNTGLLRLTPAQFANLPSLNFRVGSTTFTLTPNAQAFPRNLNTAIGGNANSVYLIVNSIGTPTGQGLDFINGMTFLERFYSVFDTTNRRVGLATTPFTTATTN